MGQQELFSAESSLRAEEKAHTQLDNVSNSAHDNYKTISFSLM